MGNDPDEEAKAHAAALAAAALAQKQAEAAKAQAEAAKTLAEAQASEADAAKTRADAEAATKKAATDAEAAALTNEKTRLEIETAKQTAADAVADRTVTKAKEAIPDLASVPQNGLSLAENYVFHRAELSRKALEEAVTACADAIAAHTAFKAEVPAPDATTPASGGAGGPAPAGAVTPAPAEAGGPTPAGVVDSVPAEAAAPVPGVTQDAEPVDIVADILNADPTPPPSNPSQPNPAGAGKGQRVLIMSGENLATAPALYLSVVAEAGRLLTNAEVVIRQAESDQDRTGIHGGRAFPRIAAATLEGVLSTIAVAGDAFVAIASALQVDASLSGSQTAADLSTTHLLLARALLKRGFTDVAIEMYTTPQGDSSLLQLLAQVARAFGQLQTVNDGLKSKLARDGLGAAAKEALATEQHRVQAASDEIAAFVSAITTSTDGRPTPLSQALAGEPLLDDSESAPIIAIAPAPQISVDQVVIKRRIFRSRLVTSAFAQANVVLQRHGGLIVIASETGSLGFEAVFRGSGPRLYRYRGLGYLRRPRS